MTDIEFTSNLTVTLVDSMGTEQSIARAARVSTVGLNEPTDPERDKRLVQRLWRDGHTSPFESCVVTVAVDAPIFVAREWMRHRSMSYSEVSGRYQELKPRFYLPNTDERPLVQTGKAMDYDLILGTAYQRRNTVSLHQGIYEESWEAYQMMLRLGVAREVARNVLPVGIYTQFYATANLNNWLKFLNLRTDDSAQWEIRALARQVKNILTNLYPTTLGAWRNDVS